jgi:hypothetical protein
VYVGFSRQNENPEFVLRNTKANGLDYKEPAVFHNRNNCYSKSTWYPAGPTDDAYGCGVKSRGVKMKRLDASEQGILEISWSPDGAWVVYTAGDEIRLANVETGDIRTIGEGTAPRMTTENRVVFERDGDVWAAWGNNTKVVVSRNQLVKESPKGLPLPSPDGEQMIFAVFNVYDKMSQSLNAYPYRHFIGLATPTGSGACLTKEQWYGGGAIWFPDSANFAHFEFDSTAGPQIHICDRKGNKEGIIAGLYPSVAPDGAHIAARPRNGGSMMIYSSKGGWSEEAVTMSVIKLPVTENRRPSAIPPVWLDNRTAVVIEGETAFRVDTKKEKAELLKKFPIPTDRRTPSLVPSPNREQIAMEVALDGGYELRAGRPF